MPPKRFVDPNFKSAKKIRNNIKDTRTIIDENAVMQSLESPLEAYPQLGNLSNCTPMFNLNMNGSPFFTASSNIENDLNNLAYPQLSESHSNLMCQALNRPYLLECPPERSRNSSANKTKKILQEGEIQQQNRRFFEEPQITLEDYQVYYQDREIITEFEDSESLFNQFYDNPEKEIKKNSVVTKVEPNLQEICTIAVPEIENNFMEEEPLPIFRVQIQDFWTKKLELKYGKIMGTV